MKRLITLSLVFNCLLMGLALRHLSQSHQRPLPREPRLNLTQGAEGRSTRSLTHSVKTATPWSILEARDPAQFMANLRAVCCPERTIRDILVFRVCRSYWNQLIASETEVGRTLGYVH